MPLLSFVIITYQRPEMLRRCLESLALDDGNNVEALVVLNGKDAGSSILRAELPRRYPGVKVLSIPRSSRGAARNFALAQAAGDIVYFLDDDTIAPTGFAHRILEKFHRYPEVSCIGGPNLAAPGATLFQKAVDFALGSPLGSGPMRVRYCATGKDRLLPSWGFMLCNLGMRRDAFAQCGHTFPERCVSAEENLFLYRAERSLGRALYSPELFVHHVRRENLAAYGLQVFESGRGRMQITRMEPHSLLWVIFLPLVWLSYLFSLGFVPWTPWTLAPLATYGLMCLMETMRLWKRERQAPAAAWLPLLLLLGHVSYALGLLLGSLLPVDPSHGKASCQS